MDSLTDRDKYLWSLLEKLPFLPRVGLDQDHQQFRAVQLAVYDITAIEAAEDFIREIENGTYQTLDDLQHYLTYEVGYGLDGVEIVDDEDQLIIPVSLYKNMAFSAVSLDDIVSCFLLAAIRLLRWNCCNSYFYFQLFNFSFI